jgi:hypothetical protein
VDLRQVVLTGLMFVTGCSWAQAPSGSPTAPPSSAAIPPGSSPSATEPLSSSSASPPSACTPDFGTNQVKELFAAFNSGNEQRVTALIFEPAPRQDGLEVVPTLQRFAQGYGVGDPSDIQVHTKSDLDAFMRDITGYQFELIEAHGTAGTNLQSGPGAWIGPAVAVGPITWRATSDALARQGHRSITGGGKTLVACPSGKFARALFSPSGFE